MGDMILLLALVGIVSATARSLYRQPIQWSDEEIKDHSDPR
jgi:hypothetical protein